MIVYSDKYLSSKHAENLTSTSPEKISNIWDISLLTLKNQRESLQLLKITGIYTVSGKSRILKSREFMKRAFFIICGRQRGQF